MNELQQYITAHGPDAIKGLASGAAAGIAVDVVAWRSWVKAIKTTNPSWADDLVAQITRYKWGTAIKRALVGALVGALFGFAPWLAVLLGFVGFPQTGQDDPTT